MQGASERNWGRLTPCLLRKLQEKEKDKKKQEEMDELQQKRCFSEEAIRNLSNRLRGGGDDDDREERMKDKTVYLATSSSHLGPTSWVRINPTPSTDMSVSVVDCLPKDLINFGCTVWKSTKIIIAGGFSREGAPSDKVFVYDTSSNTWDPPSCMILQRPEKPTLVVADNKLFIFAGYPKYNWHDIYNTLDPSDIVYDADYADDGSKIPVDPLLIATEKKVWAEFCIIHDDTTTSCSWSWSYLPPSHRFPSEHMAFPAFASHVVYPKKNLLLFWDCYSQCVFSFNYRKGNWEKFKGYMPINRTRCWNNSVVIVEDFVFWYDDGKIYANDLIGEATHPVCIMSDKDMFELDCDDALPTFLVNVGKNKLCLFGCFPVNRIYYCTFWVKIGRVYGQPPRLDVEVDAFGFLDAAIPMLKIENAVALLA